MIMIQNMIQNDPQLPRRPKSVEKCSRSLTPIRFCGLFRTLKQSPGSEEPPVSEAPSSELPCRISSISLFVGLPQYLRLLQAWRRPQDLEIPPKTLTNCPSGASSLWLIMQTLSSIQAEPHKIGSASRRSPRNKALLLALGYFKLGGPLQ